MSKPKAPAPPNYEAAAIAQGQANKDAALATGQLSNPNVTNPYGTQTVTYQNDPTTGNPVPHINQQFAPGQQRIFENEQTLQQKLGLLGIGAADMAGDTISKPLNFNERLGGIPQGRQEVVDAYMRRYDTDLGRRQESVESQLIAQGIPKGSEAWNREMERLDRGRNDALSQATLTADDRAMQERRQLITELLAERQTPLNEVSAFRTGSQIQPLQFSGVQGANVGAAPVFDAATQQGAYGMGQYGQKMGTYNNMMSGLFRLGSAAVI